MTTTEATTVPTRGAYMNWTLGRKTVTSLSDGFNPVDYDIIHSVTPEKGAELQRAANRPARPVFTHTMFLIRGAEHGPILVDAGMGNMAGPTLGWLPDSLAMAGIAPEDIELVLLTHLHPDHCFGLVDDVGRARFPNAKLAVHSDEYAFWFEPEREAKAPDSLKPYFALVRASVEPYRERIEFFRDGVVAPGVTVFPLPGHTPGHSGFKVSSAGQDLLIWADTLHLPAIQPSCPDAGVIHDVDRNAAAATRKRIFAEVAAKGQLVAGCHLEFPSVARLIRDGDAYRLIPAFWPSATGEAQVTAQAQS
ncbi:MBL fold metallo-hydrolase [Burkholderia multivorans]|uniref:MBL fold metallo-hydrolase n=1 Tax=Burkholderia multivorans TaxID=87883 RepID=UPI0015921AFC|nr:MBL fold metallo-hydrolase [Burkholderia multivorans]